MNHELNNEETIRRFLLGEMTAAEQEEIEIRLLGNAEFQTVVEIAEFDLIDDYVRGNLTEVEADSFRRHFLNSSERRDRLETARAWLKTPEASATENGSNSAPGRVVNVRQGVAAARWNFHFDWRWVIPVAAAIILALGIGVAVRRLFFQSPVDQAVATLKKAYRQERPIESRLSGFDHAPWVQRRGAEQQSANRTLRDQVARILLGEVNDRPNAQSRHALGALYLLEQKTDEAIEQLEEALKTDPGNAQIHNDLGVALMELAKTQKEKAARDEQAGGPKSAEQSPGESLKTFARANEHFAQALQFDPTLAAALFNQALCLQHLGLINQATASWQKYLQLDAGSGWADEARRRLAELEGLKKKTSRNHEQLFQDFLAAAQSPNQSEADERLWEAFGASRERMGNVITERLLDEYLRLSAQGGDDEAGQWLALLSRAGELEASKTGDLYTRDLARFYRRSAPRQRAWLTEARELFKMGREKNRTSYSKAGDFYQRARQLFAQAGSKCEVKLMDYFVCVIHLRLSQHDQGRKMAEALAGFAESRSYLWLYAHALDALADLHININEDFQAINCSMQALALSERTRDWNEALCVLAQLGLEYWVLGDYEQSLRWLARAWEVSSRYPTEAQSRWMVYGVTTHTLSSLNLPFTSVVCEKEAAHLAEEMGSPHLQSRAYGYLGSTYAKLGHYDEAFQQLTKALTVGDGVSDVALGQNIKAFTLLRLGHLYRTIGNLSQALQCYDECVRISEQRQIIWESFDAHRGRLLVYLARQDYQGAQAELQTALKLFEDNRAKIREESLKNSFFETGQDVYDLAIRFYAEAQRNHELAFDYSERSRARSLLDLIRVGTKSEAQKRPPKTPSPDEEPENDERAWLTTASHLSLSEIKRRMPASSLIVQYAVLDQSLHIWVVSANDFNSAIKEIRLDNLNARVGQYLKCLSGQSECQTAEAESQAKELYKILVQPIEFKLDASKEICIVPDKFLNYLPFAALLEPVSGKYLIEKYTIIYAPSSTVFLARTESAKQRGASSSEQCLSVGNPSFDRERFPSLPELPSTESEAVCVARCYERRRLLLAREAKESALRREMPQVEIIHIASHGIANEQMPELSGVIMANEGAGAGPFSDGMLQAWEVSRLKLPRARLVVLAACQTWIGRNYYGEGMVGLARAFIVADVPLVIASLWPVKTAETEELMCSFHQQRTQGSLSTAQALRKAQLKMLQHPNSHYRSPSAWAGFIAVGGAASF